MKIILTWFPIDNASANQRWRPMEDIVLLNNFHEGVFQYIKIIKKIKFCSVDRISVTSVQI